MSVQEEINRITNAKDNLKGWLLESGVEVPENAKIDELVLLAKENLSGGGAMSDEVLLTMANVDPTVFVVSGGTVSFNYLPNTTLIVWGDGAMDEYDPSTLTKDDILTHTYSTTGIYTVKVYGGTLIRGYFAMACSGGTPTVFSPTWLLEAKIGNTVTEIEPYAFSSCSTLYKVEFGSGVTELKEGLFISCSMLTEVTVPSCVTKIYGFGAGGNLKQVYFNNRTPPTPNFANCAGNPFSGGYAIVPEQYATAYKNKWYISYIAYYNKTIMQV